MKATVTLKEGKSYTWGPHVFTRTPSVVTDRDEIAKLKCIGSLSVEISEDEPIAPPETDEGEGDNDGDEGSNPSSGETRKPAPTAKKVVPTKSQGKVAAPKAAKPPAISNPEKE